MNSFFHPSHSQLAFNFCSTISLNPRTLSSSSTSEFLGHSSSYTISTINLFPFKPNRVNSDPGALRMMKIKIKRYKEERYIARLSRFLKDNGPTPVRVVAERCVKPKAIFTELEFFMSRPELFKLRPGTQPNDVIVSLVEDSSINEDDMEMWKSVFIAQSADEAKLAKERLKAYKVFGVYVAFDGSRKPSLVFISTANGFMKGTLPLGNVFIFDLRGLRHSESKKDENSAPSKASLDGVLSKQDAEIFRQSLSDVLESPASLKIMCDSRNTCKYLKQKHKINVRGVIDLHAVYGVLLTMSERFGDVLPAMPPEPTASPSKGGNRGYSSRRNKESDDDDDGENESEGSRARFQKTYLQLLARYGLREKLKDTTSVKQWSEAWNARPISTEMARAGIFYGKYLMYLAYQLLRDISRVSEKANFWTLLRRARAFRALLDIPASVSPVTNSSTGSSTPVRGFDSLVSIPVNHWVLLQLSRTASNSRRKSVSAAIHPQYLKLEDASQSGALKDSCKVSHADVTSALESIFPENLAELVYKKVEELQVSNKCGPVEEVSIDSNGNVYARFAKPVASILLSMESDEPTVKVMTTQSSAVAASTLGYSVEVGQEVIPFERIVERLEMQFGERLSAQFGNACGVNGTLHRVVVVRGRTGSIRSVSLQLGQHGPLVGSLLGDVLSDVHVQGKSRARAPRLRSILVCGPASSGKTSLLRESARILSEEHQKRVVIVDTFGDLAGSVVGTGPQESDESVSKQDSRMNLIGRSRVVQIPRGVSQGTMIGEAARVHAPNVLIIDELSDADDVAAVKAIMRRGIAVLCGVHARSLETTLRDPELCELLSVSTTLNSSSSVSDRKKPVATLAGPEIISHPELRRHSPSPFASVVECRSIREVVLHRDAQRNIDLYRRLGLLELEERVLASIESNHGGNQDQHVMLARFNYDLLKSLEHDAPKVEPQLGADWANTLKRSNAIPEPSVAYVLFEKLVKREAIEEESVQKLTESVPVRDYYQEQLVRRKTIRMPSGYNPLNWGEVRGMKPDERPATILRRLIDSDQLDLVLGPRSNRIQRLKDLGEVDADGRPIKTRKDALSLDYPGMKGSEVVVENEEDEELAAARDRMEVDLNLDELRDVDVSVSEKLSEQLGLSEDELQEKMRMIMALRVDPDAGDDTSTCDVVQLNPSLRTTLPRPARDPLMLEIIEEGGERLESVLRKE
eukprot:CAMPEP_0182447400 /NCGR_PEP_ID=MMETSP1172-20130603/15628_1 /TAXON_ID=708627 /ORGANISM="Timspurckia oligopyrenoides, Strain CCMP3278" /LENGTH=1204 /DNA_ID=CAMNT_0024643823 /DNA_START=94 /DNA_END=3708 /DNA_ORIENTATION=-